MHVIPQRARQYPHLPCDLSPSSLFSNGAETFISWSPQKERGSLGLLGLMMLQDFASLLTMNYDLPFQAQHTCVGGTGHAGPSPVGTRMSGEESRYAVQREA